MHTEYPSFIFNNEKFFIIPGSRFKKSELQARLKIMGIQDINSSNQDKKYFINLYETSLKNNQNKLKILPQLRKDTDNLLSKLAMSQRQSLPQNMMSTNPTQNNNMNISYDVQTFNKKNQQFNFVQPIHTNKSQLSQNPFISTNMNQNQSNSSISYEYSNNIKNKDNSNINANKNSTINYNNSFTDKNNSSFNQENHFKKNNNNNESSMVSNSNNSKIFNYKVEEQINKDNNYNNITSQHQFYSKKYVEDIQNNMNNNINNNFPNNKQPIEQYKEKTNNNEINNNYMNNIKSTNQFRNEPNNINNRFYNNTNTNINENDKRYIHQKQNNRKNTNQNVNYINYNNNDDDNNKTYTNIPNQNQYDENAKYNCNNNNLRNTANYKNTYSLDNTASNSNYMHNNINTNDFDNKNEQSGIQEKQILSNEEYEKNIIVNSNEQKEPDEISNFSLFSNFKKLKEYPFYKNKKLICIHAILLILILCIAISLLHLINYSWESITIFFDTLINEPTSIFESISSFFFSIIFGALNYYYIIIPLIIIAVFGYFYFKRYFLKKRIRKIFKTIKNDLINNNNVSNGNGMRFMSEDEIFERYVKEYGISREEYVKKYLPKLETMRKNDNVLKEFRKKIDGKEVTFWNIFLNQAI